MVKGLQITLILFAIDYGLAKQYDDKAVELLVYNGEKLNSKLNKHLVQLVVFGVNFSVLGARSDEGFCSGSIISDRCILSSAHCFLTMIIVTKIEVKSYERGKFRKIAEGVEVILRDQSFVLHNDDPKNVKKDLALVFTRRRMRLDGRVQPIKLAAKSIPVGRSAMVSGFGEVAPGISGARQGVVETSTCPFESESSLLCSNCMVKPGKGDSGGSLVYKGQLAGVTSMGCKEVYYSKPCLTYYVNVAANLEWIIENAVGL